MNKDSPRGRDWSGLPAGPSARSYLHKIHQRTQHTGTDKDIANKFVGRYGVGWVIW